MLFSATVAYYVLLLIILSSNLMSTHQSPEINGTRTTQRQSTEEVEIAIDISSSSSSQSSSTSIQQTQRQQVPIQAVNDRKEFVRLWDSCLANRDTIRYAEVFLAHKLKLISNSDVPSLQFSSRTDNQSIPAEVAQAHQLQTPQVAKTCA